MSDGLGNHLRSARDYWVRISHHDASRCTEFGSGDCRMYYPHNIPAVGVAVWIFLVVGLPLLLNVVRREELVLVIRAIGED